MWRENCDVDLDVHIRPVSVPAPGGRRELDEVIGRIASTPLDRGRPLWEIHVAEGLEGGRVALITKIHHALADGLATANLLALAVEAPAEDPPLERDLAGADPEPTTREILRQALLDHATQARALPGLVGRTASGIRRLRTQRPATPSTSADVLKPPRTFLNRAVSSERSFSTLSLPLAEAKALGKELGITLNDVVLGVATGVMRHLLLEHDGHADSPIVASIAVGTDTSTRRITGNRIGALLVSLPVQLEDPADRFREASRAAQVAKEQYRLLGPELMQDWLEYVPPKPFERYSQRVSRLRQADTAPPRMNVVVSNVPGPRERLSIAGLPLSSFYSVGPLWEGCGLNMTVWSYVDQLNVTVLADRALLPGAHVVTELFLESFQEARLLADLPSG
jgi:diacylglycerol O-acyltransferase